MKRILIQTDGAIGSVEYGRMLELELSERGAAVVSEAENGVEAYLAVCDVFTDEIAEDTAAMGENGLPVFVCARELEATVPSGVTGLERPLDVKRFCDALAAEETVNGEPPTATFAISTPKEGIVIDRLRRAVTCQGESVSLTAREYDLLSYLEERRGTPVSREELVREVWGLPTSETNVVDVYIRYLRKKLDEPFDARYIVTVRGKGYQLK